MFRRHLIWVLALAVLTPAVASAQWAPQPRYGQAPRTLPGYDAGYERGLRAGGDDLRRRAAFNFSVHVDFRRGDIGYRSQYGSRDRYRDEFRRGFEVGYRAGYSDGRGGYGGGAWAPGRAVPRADVAVQQGYSDGYEAGVNDARARRQFDPIGERRYRSADRGYNRSYGPKDRYQVNYRTGFREGYEDGYRAVAGRPGGYNRGW
jgi:hypothetical protein